MIFKYWPAELIIISAMIITIIARKLTVAASLIGGLLAAAIFAGAGYMGLTMLAAFFILGTAATSYKAGVKQSQALAEKDKGRRTASQVLANAGMAAILGALAYLYPAKANLFMLMITACFASAAADTLSSELGVVFGKKFYNIITLKKDAKGLDGVVSVEGTFAGIMGSVLIAIIYAMWNGWNIYAVWIIIAGTLGNLSDSLLGATLERKHYINNDVVNFLNTLVAAAFIYILSIC